MLLDDFKAILVSADPNVKRNKGNGTGNYTVWTPGAISREMSDDSGDDLIQRHYVERFTKLDNDPIFFSLWRTLESNFIPFEHEHDYETDKGYHHHTFTCHVQVDF